MIEIGRFGDFNDSRINPTIKLPLPHEITKEDVIEFENHFPEKYPKIYQLQHETTKFYETYFGDLINTIAREKRKMVFETPNRVNLTYEYELEGSENLNDSAYYLFNTRDRLSWLTIHVDKKQVAIVSRIRVLKLLEPIISDELKELSKATSREENDILEELYELSDGKPCFIHCKANVKSIELSYYDSVQYDNVKINEGCGIITPIVEKRINYTYRTLAPVSNCWFYVRSPKDFNICVNDIVDKNENKANIERSKSQDLEIQSMVIKGKKQRQNIHFSITVTVPSGLKCWYYSIYIFSILAILFALVLIFVHCFYTEPILWIEQLIKNAGKGWFAIVAALITTRGRLMHESHAYNRLSKCFTAFVVLLLMEAFVLAGLHEKRIIDSNENIPLPKMKRNTVDMDSISHWRIPMLGSFNVTDSSICNFQTKVCNDNK